MLMLMLMVESRQYAEFRIDLDCSLAILRFINGSTNALEITWTSQQKCSRLCDGASSKHPNVKPAKNVPERLHAVPNVSLIRSSGQVNLTSKDDFHCALFYRYLNSSIRRRALSLRLDKTKSGRHPCQ